MDFLKTVKNTAVIEEALNSDRLIPRATLVLWIGCGIMLLFIYAMGWCNLSDDLLVPDALRTLRLPLSIPPIVPIIAFIVHIRTKSFCSIPYSIFWRLWGKRYPPSCLFSEERVKSEQRWYGFWFSVMDCVSLFSMLIALYAVFSIAIHSVQISATWNNQNISTVIVCYAACSAIKFASWLQKKNESLYCRIKKRHTNVVDANNKWIMENDLVVYHRRMYRIRLGANGFYLAPEGIGKAEIFTLWLDEIVQNGEKDSLIVYDQN